MAATTSKKPVSKRGQKVAKRSGRPGGQEAKRAGSLEKAHLRRQEISDLKADARGRRLGAEALLADPRAGNVKVLTLLSMIPRCSLRAALDALLVCQINGARPCGELTAAERRALTEALSQIGHGIAPPSSPAMPSQPEGVDPERVDRELDRALRATQRAVPAVELRPSEFAAARSGLEADPQLLRMIDRLVGTARYYAEDDDGGFRARGVVEQWIRFRNYRAKVASGEYPPPSERGPGAPK